MASSTVMTAPTGTAILMRSLMSGDSRISVAGSVSPSPSVAGVAGGDLGSGEPQHACNTAAITSVTEGDAGADAGAVLPRSQASEGGGCGRFALLEGSIGPSGLRPGGAGSAAAGAAAGKWSSQARKAGVCASSVEFSCGSGVEGACVVNAERPGGAHRRARPSPSPSPSPIALALALALYR